jgi:hypothetical protein
MRAWIESLNLAATTLRVTAAEPLPADQATLAVASAIRLFERFPALDGLVLVAGGDEVSLARADVERLLAPEGFRALQDRSRWSRVLARAVRRHAGAVGESGA